MLQTGQVLQNRYEILKIIGKGGMSTVYQARDLKNNNLLAVKDVERAGKDENREMEQKLAVAEGRMLMQLSNSHLPRIYDIIENQNNFLLIMDYIDGVSLDKVIAKMGAQPMERVLNWGMQICEVFDYLHHQPTPIIYRDMKPANVMLKRDGNLMMIDFGTARTLKQGVAMQEDTICIGTAGFAAPEQFGGIGQSTARTDIFCLGATLYNMITGHSPCEKPMGILPLEYWNPALANTPLSEIIQKCTRNDPNERYQTAMELHEDLRLASLGMYRSASARGKGGPLSGGLRKADWQKQDVKGAGMISGGLSGLLQWGKPGQTGVAAKPPEKEVKEETADKGWQRIPAVPAQPPEIPVPQTQPEPQSPEQGGMEENWRRLMLIAAALALVFVVFAVISVALQQTVMAIVFLMFAFGGAALAVVGVINIRR